jgi:hypothetical protein
MAKEWANKDKYHPLKDRMATREGWSE